MHYFMFKVLCAFNLVLRTPSDETENINNHKKFLFTPIYPPILDMRVHPFIVNDDLAQLTALSKYMDIPFMLLLTFSNPIFYTSNL